MAFQEYPKQMNHPNYRPAVVSGYRRNPDGSAVNDPPGTPAKFPPVVVNNVDQEQDYASKGYLPAGVSDPQAYLRATIGAETPGVYKFQEYPKWMYRVEDDELQSQMVQSEAEERRMGEGWYATPDAAWGKDEQDDHHATNDASVQSSPETVLLRPATIRGEFERLLGDAVELSLSEEGESCAYVFTHASGAHVDLRVFDDDRAMSLQAFSRRMLEFPVLLMRQHLDGATAKPTGKRKYTKSAGSKPAAA